MVKVERSFPAPASLAIEAQKANGSYSGRDVVMRLQEDFHNKCYICELGELQDPEVEHLLPHCNGRYPERKFDWNNLFWSCRHCNGVKNQRKYDVGIVDCCRDDPEELIWFRFQGTNVSVSAKNPDNAQAALTAELVTEVFNLQNTGIRTSASDQRMKELMREMNKLYAALEEMKRNPRSPFGRKTAIALLKRESSFAAFKRNYIAEHRNQFPELIEYIT